MFQDRCADSPQGYELQLNLQSGRTLAPNRAGSVTQMGYVSHAGDKQRKVDSIKLRWRVSYKVGGQEKNETGDIPEFTIA